MCMLHLFEIDDTHDNRKIWKKNLQKKRIKQEIKHALITKNYILDVVTVK